MFENAKNVTQGNYIKRNGLTLPVYELRDISKDEWNARAAGKKLKINTLNSRVVADMVEKRHADLLRDIETYTKYLNEATERNFALSDFFLKSQYVDGTGRKLPCYEITKLGCEMIANKMTGKKGVIFTALYVKKFNEMEATAPTASAKEVNALNQIENIKNIPLEQIDEILKELKEATYIIMSQVIAVNKVIDETLKGGTTA